MNDLQLRGEDLPWRLIDEEVVALEARRCTYVATNAAGGLLWSMLAAGTTREALVDALVDRYAIDAGLAARDVDVFVEQLRAQELLAP
jgi:Coenzyme PQQ synthesis protein D (PqqD)